MTEQVTEVAAVSSLSGASADRARSTRCIIIPCVCFDTLVERCVKECQRTAPYAQITIIPDHGRESACLGGKTRIIVSGPCTIAAKRNLGARATTAEYLAFIDSDAFPADRWLDNSVRWLEEDPSLGAVGGPNISPPQECNQEKYVGFALQSVLVSGSGYYLKAVSAARYVSDLPSCNLVVRRADYVSMGGMNEQLFTGEDIDFCLRLAAQGKRILYSPDVLVYHKNRNIRNFCAQRITYGASAFKLMRAHFTLRIIMLFVPAAFLIFLSSAPLMIWATDWMWVYMSVVGLYISALLIESVRTAPRWRYIPGTILALVIGSLAPGVGTIFGMFGLLPNLRKLYSKPRLD